MAERFERHGQPWTNDKVQKHESTNSAKNPAAHVCGDVEDKDAI